MCCIALESLNALIMGRMERPGVRHGRVPNRHAKREDERMKNLGFGMMRLPVRNGDPTDFEEALAEAMRIYRESAPIPQSQIDRYQGLEYHGVPVTAILQAYSICQIQPDPGFSDDNNYLKNNFAESEHVDFREGLATQRVVTADGTDITETVEKAVAWLAENSF
jgi:hypothetical protein